MAQRDEEEDEERAIMRQTEEDEANKFVTRLLNNNMMDGFLQRPDCSDAMRLSQWYESSSYGFIPDGIMVAAMLEEAAFHNNVDAMSRLAREYLFVGSADWMDHPMPYDIDRARHWFKMLRDGSGLSDVAAEFYKLGAIDKAISLWTMATEMRDPERAMIRLGSCYQHGMGVECNPTKAVSLYNAAANEDPDLSWHMGLCYLHGEGVPRDWPKAVALLQQSHSGEAQAHLGWCHLWGCGVERDVTKAVSLLTSLTHNQFNPIANAFLGYCYERGIGVEIDLDKAKHLYGCEENEDAEALRVLGMYCLRGDCGAPIDKKAAAAYFKRGAEKCDPVSRFHFGVCLRDGDGVECNVDEAHCWLEKAAKSGHRGASNILENIACNSPHSVRLEEHCDGMNPTEQQEDTVETLKKQVVYLKEHVAELEKKNEEEHSATISSQKAFNKKEEEFLARKEKLSRKIDRLEQDNLHLVRHVNGAELALFHERRAVRALQNEKAQLEIHLRDTEAALCKERVVVANIRKALKAVDKPQRYEDTVNTVMVGRMNPEKTARLSATNDISRLQSISPQCHQSQLQKAPSSSKTGVKPNTQRKKETPGRVVTKVPRAQPTPQPMSQLELCSTSVSKPRCMANPSLPPFPSPPTGPVPSKQEVGERLWQFIHDSNLVPLDKAGRITAMLLEALGVLQLVQLFESPAKLAHMIEEAHIALKEKLKETTQGETLTTHTGE